MAIALIEWRAGRILPEKHPNHEVDQLLYDLDHGRIPAHETLFFGDSVGRQIARALLSKEPHAFATLAVNGSVEMAGQYFILRRYLEGHPAPKRIVCMMFGSVEGQLAGIYTENYFQREFLRWREIAEIAWAKKNLSFSLVMVAYKLSPVFCHRIGLQTSIPLPDPLSPWSGDRMRSTPTRNPTATTEYGLLEMISSWRRHHPPDPQIAETYFHRFASLVEAHQIEWAWLAPPLAESSHLGAPDELAGRQMNQLAELNSRYPGLRLDPQFRRYPDDWFSDGLHLHEEYLPVVAQDYADILNSMGFGKLPE